MSEQSLDPLIEPNIQHKPEFDGGSFTIEYLSASPTGFEVQTDKSSPRRNPGSPLPLNENQRKQLKNAMVGQMKFAEGNKAKEALDKLRNATGEEKNQAMEEYQKRRTVYQERVIPLIGIRHVRKEGNRLTVDIRVVDYPTYQEFGNENSTPELIDFATPSSTSVAIVTKDQRFIIQRRSARNKMYRDVPGASASGYFNGKFDRPGIFSPLTTGSVKDNSFKETEEEIGLEKEDFSDTSIVALTLEKLKIHHDFLLLSQSNLTIDEIKQKNLAAGQNSRSEEEFDEKFVDVPATLDSVETLVAEIKCPLPLTHVALFVAVGYNMVLKEKGIDEANKWKTKIEVDVKENFRQIDQMVQRYYQENPEELTKAKGVAPRNPKGYEPAYLPQEQGLPDMMSEFKRVGLINE